MKKIFFASAIFGYLALSSCATGKVIPLSGNYPTMPVMLNTEKSVESTWDKLIDLFAQKGLSIKVIDRSSGLIISDKTIFKTTVENEKGKLEDDNAWIVVSKVHDNALNRKVAISGTTSGVYSKQLIPRDVTGEWNVRIKKDESGKTIINVNIVNVTYSDYVATGMGSPGYYKDVPLNGAFYKSTGVFEKLITDLIK